MVVIIIINEKFVEDEPKVNLLISLLSFIPLDRRALARNSSIIPGNLLRMTGEEASTSAVSKKAPSYLPLSSPPSECPTPAGAEANAMLAKEMNQLSAEEREKMLEDVHGIARVMDEPQEFIEASLALLEKELTNISNKVAYDLASSMSKKYTSSKKRRLMFLRAESFDAYNAASRMVRFFDQKYELFGPHNLTKDITLDDLDPDDIAALEKGFYQVLPEKDRAGRLVFCYFPKLKMIRTTQNMVSENVCEAG